ncbi:monocarboxylate transporter 12-like [Diadema antillarum]|uniref:monocarboxylate transporter 12-like n=1 Tax=Diadema antillarum TaxID=105358 RepID=UPI003A89B4F1
MTIVFRIANKWTPFLSYLVKRTSPRKAAFLGAISCSVGLVSASFSKSAVALGFSMSFLGIGNNILIICTILGINEHFPVRFGVINTLAIMGSPVGAFLLPVVSEKLFEYYGLWGTIFILASLYMNTFACAATLRPLTKSSAPEKLVDFKQLPTSESNHREVQNCPTEDIGYNGVPPKKDRRRNFLARYSTYLCQATNLSVLHRSPLFSLFVISNFFLMAVWAGWTLFLVPHAEYLGISQSNGSYLAMIGGIGGFFGLAISSSLLYFKPNSGVDAAAVSGLVGSVVFFFDYIDSSFPFQAMHAFIIGFILYSQCALIVVGVKYAVPPEDFNMGLGLTLVAYGAGTLTGSFVTGLLFDVTSDYRLAFVVFGIAELLMFFCYFTYALLTRFSAKYKIYNHIVLQTS